MSAPSFVAAGGLRVDYLITRDGKANSGLPGGNALYAAAGAALWREEVALWARFGQNYPHYWLDILRQLGLNTEGLVALPGDHDHRTFYAYTPDGQRDDTNPAAHFARFNLPFPEALTNYVHSTPRQDEAHEYEPLALRPDEWPEAFTEATAVHLSPLPLATHLHVPAALRRQGSQQISVDPGERYMIPERIPFIRQILPNIDAFLPSDQEVRSLFGDGIDLKAAADTFITWGAPLVVIKSGAEGIWLREKSHVTPLHLLPYHGPGDGRVIDVTGAGDAFCGGFMVGLAETSDPYHAVQMGLVSASLIIECYGALNALKVDKNIAWQRLGELKRRSQYA